MANTVDGQRGLEPCCPTPGPRRPLHTRCPARLQRQTRGPSRTRAGGLCSNCSARTDTSNLIPGDFQTSERNDLTGAPVRSSYLSTYWQQEQLSDRPPACVRPEGEQHTIWKQQLWDRTELGRAGFLLPVFKKPTKPTRRRSRRAHRGPRAELRTCDGVGVQPAPEGEDVQLVQPGDLLQELPAVGAHAGVQHRLAPAQLEVEDAL